MDGGFVLGRKRIDRRQAWIASKASNLTYCNLSFFTGMPFEQQNSKAAGRIFIIYLADAAAPLLTD